VGRTPGAAHLPQQRQLLDAAQQRRPAGEEAAGAQAAAPWRGGSPVGYTLTVSDMGRAAPALTRALVAAGADVLSIAQSRHTLEDV